MRVRVENVDESLEIYFRTNKVRGKSVIKVQSEDTPIAAFKRERMAPGEMEKIVIPKALVAKFGDTLKIEVEEAE